MRFPARASVSRSRTLLTTRIAVESRPTGIESRNGSRSTLLELDVVGAVDGHEPEEQEHEHLAEAGVAVGPRAAGVEDAGGDRDGADGEDLRAGDGRQVDADAERRGERDPGRVRAPAAARSARTTVTRTGPEPVGGVGAALGVRVVVGEVGPDLDQDRAGERGDERAPADVVAPRTAPPPCRPAPARSPRAASAAARPSPRCETGSRSLRGTSRSRASGPPGTSCGPPGPPRTCRRGASRRARAAGSRSGRPRWR